jgi:hypothetical protein
MPPGDKVSLAVFPLDRVLQNSVTYNFGQRLRFHDSRFTIYDSRPLGYLRFTIYYLPVHGI